MLKFKIVTFNFFRFNRNLVIHNFSEIKLANKSGKDLKMLEYYDTNFVNNSTTPVGNLDGDYVGVNILKAIQSGSSDVATLILTNSKSPVKQSNGGYEICYRGKFTQFCEFEGAGNITLPTIESFNLYNIDVCVLTDQDKDLFVKTIYF